jgi:putative ABC transport system substrate-binding protein
LVSPIAELEGPNPAHPITRAFVHEMQRLGYEEGRNLILERRSAEGQPERYAAIIRELVDLDADVIVSAGDRRNAQAKAVTSTVPIVIFAMGQPVKSGLVSSFAHPGGNITGLTVSVDAEIEAKRLELLKEALPSVSRVAYFLPRGYGGNEYAKATRSAAERLRIELVPVEHLPRNLEVSFSGVKKAAADALFVSLNPVAYGQRQQIVEFASSARLPTMVPYTAMVETGALMGYGVDVIDLGRRAAHYVDKILRGAKPGDLPIERPTKFNFVVNMRTAKELGITIAPSVLLRADRVIE